jgi:hypothetical protein
VGVGLRIARSTGAQRLAIQAGADARGPAALCPRTHLRRCRWRIPLGSRDSGRRPVHLGCKVTQGTLGKGDAGYAGSLPGGLATPTLQTGSCRRWCHGSCWAVRAASADLLTPSALLAPLALVATAFFLVALVLWLSHMALWQLFQRPFDACILLLISSVITRYRTLTAVSAPL